MDQRKEEQKEKIKKGTAQKDKIFKLIERYADVFADIVNVLAFHGNRLLKEENLIPGPTESVYEDDRNSLREQRRDVLKYDRQGNTFFSVIGLENQSTVDPNMIFRIMKYNTLSYQVQIDQKEPLRRPAITLVLYFGIEHWNAPTTLFDWITTDDIPYKDYLPELIQNHRINLIEVAFLSEEVRSQFTSDFRVVADYFYALREGKELEFIKNNKKDIHHVEDFFHLFKIFSENSIDYEKFLQGIMQLKEKGEPVSMSVAFEKYVEDIKKQSKEDGINEGFKKGKEDGINEGFKKGKEDGINEGFNQATKLFVLRMLKKGMPNKTIMQLSDVTDETLKELRKEYEAESQHEQE